MTERDRSHPDWDDLRALMIVQRTFLGLSQEDVARRCDPPMHRRNISSIENGKRVPTATVLARLLPGYGLRLGATPTSGRPAP